MFDQNCIFCKIITQQLPAKVIAENDTILVIKDIAPKAPIHYLILPKVHIADIQSLQQNNTVLASQMILMAKELSQQLPAPHSFRLVSNNGYNSGQRVFHMHFHFLSGTTYTDL